MLDFHTHLLPGIDDGAADLEVAMALCTRLYQQGIREVVVTPHWCSPRFEVEAPRVVAAWEGLVAAAAKTVPGLRMHLGAEHHLSGLQSSAAFVDSVRTLGRTRCALVELPDDHLPENAWRALHAVLNAGYRPFIAHPERCRGLVGTWHELEAFTAAGGRLQFDLGNLLGVHGWRMRWRSRRMLARFRPYSVIASDCHNLRVRPPLWDRLPEAWRPLVPESLADLERR